MIITIKNQYRALLRKFTSRYEHRPFVIRQKAAYMMVLSLLILFVCSILMVVSYINSSPGDFLYFAMPAILIILLFVYFGKFRIAQILFWVVCLNELFFIFDKMNPDIIIIPEICAITFVLLLISTEKWQFPIIAVIALSTTFYRIFLSAANTGLDGNEQLAITFAYICVLAIFICIYIVSIILKKHIEDRELLLKEQAEKIVIYEELYSLELSLEEKDKVIETMKGRLYQDEVTLLYNRRAFDDLFQKFISASRRNETSSTVTYMDMDQLKYVNDEFSHSAGDEYLSIISKEIKKHIRTNDLAFRIGGDEFVVIFDNCTVEQNIVIMERIKDSFSLKTKELFSDFSGSFSYGSVEINHFPDLSAEQILEKADALMRRNKKNRKVFRGGKNGSSIKESTAELPSSDHLK